MSDRFLSRLSVFIVVGCAFCLTGTALVLSSPALKVTLGLGPVRETGYVPGEGIDLPPSLYSANARTLVIFAQSTCAVCQRAKDSLGDLAEAFTSGPLAHVVMVTGRSAPSMAAEQQFARDIGLDERQVVPLDLTTLRVRGVPTVLLVDTGGKILAVTEGAPKPSDASTFLRAAAQSGGSLE
jgi:hypothetical protein